MASIYELEMANLFAEDEDPAQSQGVVLESVKLPALTEQSTSHSGGGAIMGLNIGLGMLEALEMTFKLRGINPRVMNKIMGGNRGLRKYTILGNVRDLQAAEDISAKVVVQGRMMMMEMSEFQRESSISTDYKIGEILHYEFYLAGVEKYYVNYFDGPAGVRVDGQLVFAGAARNLGVA